MTIREELELDITSAESNVGRIGALLTQVVQDFKISFVDATNDLTITPTIDVSSVTDDISSAVDTVDATVDVGADTSGADDAITSTVDDADNADPTIDVGADTTDADGVVDDLTTTIDASDATLTVTADTAEATAGLSGVGDAAASAGDDVGGLGTDLGIFAAASGVASGSADGLAESIGSLGPAASAAVGAVAGLAAIVSLLFFSAFESVGTAQAFDASLGDMAESVANIDVAGLNTDLGDLAVQLGSDDEQLTQVTQKIYDMGIASGVAAPEVGKTTEEIVALAASVRAANPSLGTVGDIANTMTGALARGGKATAQFGIDLTSAEIQARALAATGKTAVDELTQFDKVAAGAAIAIEKYGSSIAENVEAGSGNAIVMLGRMQETFGNVLETLGAPIVFPVLELVERALPLVEAFLAPFATLGEVLIPIASAAFGGLAVAIAPALTSIGEAVQATLPAFIALANPLGEAIARFAPLFDLLATAAVPVITGIGAIAFVIGEFIGVLNQLPPVIQIVVGAIALLNLITYVNPILAVVGAVGLLVTAFTDFGDTAAPTAITNTEQFRSAMFGAADSIETTREELAAFDEEFDTFIGTTSKFAANGVTGELQATGISIEELQRQLEFGAIGFEQFTAAAIEAGQVTLEINGVEATSEQVLALNGTLDDLLISGEANITQGELLAQSFNQQQVEAEAAAEAQFNLLVTTGELTQAQADEITARADATDGVGTYSEALRLATSDLEDLGTAENQQQEALRGNAETWVFLAESIANGTVTASDFQEVADNLGITLEDVEKFAGGVNTQLDALTDAATSKLPTVNDALSGIGDAADPNKLIENLRKQTEAIAGFQVTVDLLLTQGFDDLAAFLIEQGPLVGGQYAAAIAQGRPGLAAELEANLEAHKTAEENLEAFYRDEAIPALAGEDGLFIQMAEEGTSAFGMNLDFTNASRTKLDEMREFLLTDDRVERAAAFFGVEVAEAFKPGFKESADPKIAAFRTFLETDEEVGKTAETLGIKIGGSLGEGVGAGLTAKEADVIAGAQRIANIAANAMKIALGISSPSRVMMTIGEQTAEGFVIGLGSLEAQVVAEAESIAASAAGGFDAFNAQLTGATSSLPPIAPEMTQGGTLVQVARVDVVVEYTANSDVSAAQAQEQGEAFGAGVRAGIIAEVNAL